jgi:hypothetical protein
MSTRSPGPRWESPDPPGVTGTYGKLVQAWGKRELGITFGRWQAHAIDRALRHDKNGDLVHRIVLLSTGRQNGKSVIIRSFYGWLLDEGRCIPPFSTWKTLLAAAHDAKQARIIYKGVYGDLSGIPRLLEASREATRHKGVKLTEHFGITVEDMTLDTVTGQPGSSRGLSAGAIAWDEMLTQKDWDMWEALSPTQSAQRSPIMFLTSTAGNLESVILRSFYDKLKRQASGDEKPDPTFYGAWWESEDPDAGLDWTQIRQANPALGDGRLTRAAITMEHSILPPDSWRRERLNHFVDVRAEGAFNPGVWSACRTSAPLDGLAGPFALGVDVQPGWLRATICVAGMRPDGRVGVEVFRDVRGSEADPVTAARVIAAVEDFPDEISVIAFDTVSGAAPAFARHADESGLPWDGLKAGAMVDACMDVDELIRSARVAVDDPLLDAQIPLAARRPVGHEGAFRLSRAASLGPIDAVLAMTLAVHAAIYRGPQPKIT